MNCCTRCGHPHHEDVCMNRFQDASDDWDTCICPQCRCGDCQGTDAIREAVERRT